MDEHQYALRSPKSGLAPYVETLWFQHIPIYKEREVILPNQYVELIVNFGRPHKVMHPNGGFDLQTDSWLAGPQTHYITIESETSFMVGARLKPGGVAAFFPQSASQFTDRVTPLVKILGSKAASLRQRLLAAEEDEERFDVLEHFLLERLTPERTGLPLALRAVEALQVAGGDLSIGELSQSLGVSHKHLIQQFRRIIGLRPKQLARIFRFSSILPGLQTTEVDWAQLALTAGYHDQSHFNREFQKFAGLTPNQYLRLRQHYGAAYGDDHDDKRFVPIG